jgi:hypothetical protein
MVEGKNDFPISTVSGERLLMFRATMGHQIRKNGVQEMRMFNSFAISFVLICLISVATSQELSYEPVDTFADSTPDQWGSGIPVSITTNGNKATVTADTTGQDFQGHGLLTRVVPGQTIMEDTTLDEDLTCPPGTSFAIAIGAPNITLDLGGHVLRGYAPGSGVVVSDQEGIIIRNGTIEGFNAGVVIFNAPGATVENLTVRNQDYIDPDHFIAGIVISDSQDVVVRDMLFEFPSVAHKEAVDIYASDVAVSNIEVRGGGCGVNFSFAGESCDRPNTGTVLNSRFSGIAIAGIWVACCSNVRIAGNDFTTAPGVGVGITGDALFSGGVTGLTVEGNYIHNAVTGIEFRGIIESFISNNVITDNLLWGIAMRPSLGYLTGEPGYECFYSTANMITDNETWGNGTDLYHHEDCVGNIWEGNACETKQGADIPECTPPLTSTLLLLKSGTGSGTIVSSPSGVDCGGVCFASFPHGVSVTLTATPDPGSTFNGWSGSGCSGKGTCTVTMDKAKVVTATFEQRLPVYTLSLSAGSGGTTDPAPGAYAYESGTIVSVKATANSGHKFSSWTGDVPTGKANDNPLTLTMDSDKEVKANFTETAPPSIIINRTQIYFGAVFNGGSSNSQNFIISNNGGGSLNWSVSNSQNWLPCSPTSGTRSGTVTASVDPTGLSAGTYTGTITVSDPNASNSPQTVSVTLNVYNPNQTSAPFGTFATPIDGSTVRSSIPVTGWVLDDIGVESVKIYRSEINNLIYIGDAVFVEGARPDVEQAYPGYPNNYQAGWGYMMLTNFLPDNGNGTFKIHAIAADIEGNQVTLGIKTITCDNANAVKPFGAIDTPAQGGLAAGSNYRNQGWVLTPMPNSIPTDGSTINVIVDGFNIGHPTYNVYRQDIAALFPGYANSNGALAYFDLDTTIYSNGVHTISWNVADDAGNTDGIGSRYFSIQNTGSQASSGARESNVTRFKDLKEFPLDYSLPIGVKKGYRKNAETVELFSNENENTNITIKELGRVEIHIANLLAGYMKVGNQLNPLPIGSTLDTQRDIFYWQLGPGFIGKYHLVFILKDQDGNMIRKSLIVNIVSKFSKQE